MRHFLGTSCCWDAIHQHVCCWPPMHVGDGIGLSQNNGLAPTGLRIFQAAIACTSCMRCLFSTSYKELPVGNASTSTSACVRVRHYMLLRVIALVEYHSTCSLQICVRLGARTFTSEDAFCA